MGRKPSTKGKTIFSPNFCCYESEIFAAQCRTNLAQFSTMFILPIKQNGGAGKKTLFLIYRFVFRVMSFIFAAKYSTNLAQFSTNFIFIFLQNGANFTHIIGAHYTMVFNN